MTDFTTFKGDINKDTISDFKYLLKDVAWTDKFSNENASEAYDSLWFLWKLQTRD